MIKVGKIVFILTFLFLFGISNFCLSHVKVVFAETVKEFGADSCGNTHNDIPESDQDASFSCCAVHEAAKTQTDVKLDAGVSAQTMIAQASQLDGLFQPFNTSLDFDFLGSYSFSGDFLFSVFKKE